MNIAMLIAVAALKMPPELAGLWLGLTGRRLRDGTRAMEPKAQMVGQLINKVRVPGYIPTPAEARAQMARMMALLEAPAPELPRKEDRRIPGPAGEMPVRVYAPRGTDGAGLPVLAYFHGGGFVQGDLETHDAVCAKLARWGDCLVVAVDYRLAPEAKFPAAPEDCFAAYRWLRDNAATLGGDPARVAVAGDSAGGNLSAVVSLMAARAGVPLPVAQVLIYPVVDTHHASASCAAFADGFVIPAERIAWYDEQYFATPADKDDVRAAPMRAVSLAGQPPAFVVTAGFDPLRDEGEAYAKALEAAGVPVRFREFSGQIHGFVSMSGAIPEADTCLREIGTYLKQQFGGR